MQRTTRRAAATRRGCALALTCAFASAHVVPLRSGGFARAAVPRLLGTLPARPPLAPSLAATAAAEPTAVRATAWISRRTSGGGARAMRLMADAAPLTDTSAPPPAPRARRSDAALQYITTATPFTILFCALIALVRPQLFAWFSGEYYTLGLGVMMLCTALTLQLSDFVAVLSTGKRAAAIMICAHVLLKPPTALALATLFRLDAASTSGLILLAATPAAQAASVAVLLARGNAALCVCVVTLLNLGAFALTPLLTRAFAGGLVVAIDGLAMSRTTLQVVVVPIVLGLAVNARLPRARVVACRYGPAVGSCIAALFAGSGTALISPILGSVPARLYAAVAAFHALSSGLAFVVGKGLRLSKADVRVLAILGGMQSSSLSLVLATRHMGAGGLAAVPCALSVSCMLLWGMSLASFLVWKDERSARYLATRATAASGT